MTDDREMPSPDSRNLPGSLWRSYYLVHVSVGHEFDYVLRDMETPDLSLRPQSFEIVYIVKLSKIGGVIMPKKSSLTSSSWWAKRAYGSKYKAAPDIEDWEDKQQNKILAELEEKERRKRKYGKKRKQRYRKNKRPG